MMLKTNTVWGIVITDIAIMFMAVFLSVYTNKYWFLLLLLILFCTGSCKIKNETKN